MSLLSNCSWSIEDAFQTSEALRQLKPSQICERHICLRPGKLNTIPGEKVRMLDLLCDIRKETNPLASVFKVSVRQVTPRVRLVFDI